MPDAVFTGAGIGGAGPASLPMGNALRDAVLEVMYRSARVTAPDLVTAEALTAFTGSGRKLEVVLGRLWGTIGDDALGCLMCLRVDVPNEAHMLAAVHLVRGGTHVTVNFDRGIEMASDLLRGELKLPAGAPAALRDALPRWRALVRPGGAAPRVVAGHDQFASWATDGRPAALLKVHGSLAPDQARLLDVVVVDNEELASLTAPRRLAVASVGQVRGLLITGYAGADPDVYSVLLEAARDTRAVWACYSLVPGSPVPDDCAVRGIEVHLGPPRGPS